MVLDDVNWTDEQKYPRDLQKAIFSGQGTFEQCSGHAFMRTIVHGRPVIIVMNDETADDRSRLQRWQADPWISANVRFCSIPVRLF